MTAMVSVKHGLPGGEALKYAILYTIRNMGRPADSKDITTTMLGVKKGARGWYETHSRVRSQVIQLAKIGCLREVVPRTVPRTFEYVCDIDQIKNRDKVTKNNRRVPAGCHMIHGLYVDVGTDGRIVKVVSDDLEIVRRIPYPRAGNVVERIDPVGMPYNYVRSRLYDKSEHLVRWEVVATVR